MKQHNYFMMNAAQRLTFWYVIDLHINTFRFQDIKFMYHDGILI